MNPGRAGAAAHVSREEASVEEIAVRDLRELDQYRACVELQREIWGTGFADAVPTSLLKVSQEVGGVTAGAFTSDDVLIGFVYGLTGVRNGTLTHWSHMLGVRHGYRGRGVGLRLKLFQRQRLLDRGVHEMRWTFDPLVAANAHFNLNVLGARIDRYVPNMYGDTGSELHASGTDRLISRWDLVEAPGSRLSRAGSDGSWTAAPVVNAPGSGSSGAWDAGLANVPALRIEIPRDVFALGAGGPSPADWRRRVRDALLRASRSGYRVVGFSRDGEGSVCHYLLLRDGSSAGF